MSITFLRSAVAIAAIAGSVAVTSAPASAASCTAATCVWTQGLFTGNATTNPTGALNYIFPAALGGTFTTSPVAFEWFFSVDANPTPQDAGAAAAFITAASGLSVGSLIDANDKAGTTSTLSGTGFTTTTLADAFAIHFGQGELILIFQTPIALTLSNWTGQGLSNFRSFDTLTTGGGSQGGETPLPAAVWLMGTVLGGGAGFGAWRKRKAQRA